MSLLNSSLHNVVISNVDMHEQVNWVVLCKSDYIKSPFSCLFYFTRLHQFDTIYRFRLVELTF